MGSIGKKTVWPIRLLGIKFIRFCTEFSQTQKNIKEVKSEGYEAEMYMEVTFLRFNLQG